MIKEYKGELLFLALSLILYVVFAVFGASQNFAYFSPLFGIFGLVIAWKLYEYVDDHSEGNEKMAEIDPVEVSRVVKILCLAVNADLSTSGARLRVDGECLKIPGGAA